jgi:branched-chain amino acid aminotransferase
MNFILLNGKQLPAHEPLLDASNKAFKYGDGLFETIRVVNGKIPLSVFHFNRLFRGMETIKISRGKLEEEYLSESILDLCKANDCLSQARVRLQVFRIENDQAGFVIEALPLPGSSKGWNEKSYKIDVFTGAAKSTDKLANLKSCNFLPYVMADIFAKENLLDDAILLNTKGMIADTSRANVFLIKDGNLYTPSLTEGGVDGVMRAWLIKNLGQEVIQDSLGIEDLFLASEVFLTNAVFGIRSVGSFQKYSYSSTQSRMIYSELISTIFN